MGVEENSHISPSHAAGAPPRMRLGRILLVVVPLAAILIGASWFFGVEDGAERIREWMQPPRVLATGQVFFGDEPLAGGEVTTQPLTPKLPGASGFLDQEGKFTFKMDIKGDLKDGIFVGEHKVIVRKPDPRSAGRVGAPDLLTPAQYADFDSTPLRVVISPDPAKNHFEFRLERPQASSGVDAGGATEGVPTETAESPRPARPAPMPPPPPEEAAQALLEKFDSDKDGKLSRDEARGVEGPVGVGLQTADADGDGNTDLAEITKTITDLERSNSLRSKGIPTTPGKAN